MTESKAISVRISKLEQPLDAACRRLGKTRSEVIRLALAKYLRTKNPEVREGNPTWRKK